MTAKAIAWLGGSMGTTEQCDASWGAMLPLFTKMAKPPAGVRGRGSRLGYLEEVVTCGNCGMMHIHRSIGLKVCIGPQSGGGSIGSKWPVESAFDGDKNTKEVSGT